MHQHSLQARKDNLADFNERERVIYDLLRVHGPMTDRGVMQRLGYTDPNMVRPRITELKKSDWVVECGEEVDPGTHVKVRLVKALTPAERSQLLTTNQPNLL
jgi:predicted HTH transcriptional regulator